MYTITRIPQTGIIRAPCFSLSLSLSRYGHRSTEVNGEDQRNHYNIVNPILSHEQSCLRRDKDYLASVFTLFRLLAEPLTLVFEEPLTFCPMHIPVSSQWCSYELDMFLLHIPCFLLEAWLCLLSWLLYEQADAVFSEPNYAYTAL